MTAAAFGGLSQIAWPLTSSLQFLRVAQSLPYHHLADPSWLGLALRYRHAIVVSSQDHPAHCGSYILRGISDCKPVPALQDRAIAAHMAFLEGANRWSVCRVCARAMRK